MTSAIAMSPRPQDLAGDWDTQLTGWQILRRIRHLRDRYVTLDILHDRLADLPLQWQQPTVRPWAAIPWSAVAPDQLVGIDLDTFCAILQGTINTEAPIRGYTQSSRQYLAALYPAMARFVGGQVDDATPRR